MKKYILVCLSFVLALCLCGIAGAQVLETYIPVESELYSTEEIEKAADAVMQKLAEWDTNVFLVKYAGDARSQAELEIANLGEEEKFDDAMLFITAFRTQDDASGSWAPNEDYAWSFTFLRKDGGEWELKNWGWEEVNQKSALYSVYDIMGAYEQIGYAIAQMDGVRTLNISYTDDKISSENLEYINSLDKGEFDQCAVFDVLFMSPKTEYGAWMADSLYDWTWYLGRSNNGFWEIVTYGNL